MNLKKYIFILFVGFPMAAICQTKTETIFDEASIVYSNAIYGGPVIHTHGWGASLTFAKNKTVFKSRIFQFEIVGIKHPKEVRTYNANQDGRSYIFGKLNSFFTFRPTIGMRKVVFDKIRKSGVSIGYNWRVGPSLGFTKPVYLEILVGESPAFGAVEVVKYNPYEHNYNKIYGRASWFRGLDELKIHPGIHGAFGLNFNYDQRRTGMNGLEVGASIDYFPTGPVEIMAFTNNYSVFFNFYINLQFGKKFNK